MAFHIGPEPVRIRRMLERPFGSVRWKEETPDQRRQRGVAGRCERGGEHDVDIPSFRGDAQHRARNLRNSGSGPEPVIGPRYARTRGTIPE